MYINNTAKNLEIAISVAEKRKLGKRSKAPGRIGTYYLKRVDGACLDLLEETTLLIDYSQPHQNLISKRKFQKRVRTLYRAEQLFQRNPQYITDNTSRIKQILKHAQRHMPHLTADLPKYIQAYLED